MVMQIRCPTCGSVCQAPDAYAGRQFACAACSAAMVVPIPVATALPIDDDDAELPRRRRSAPGSIALPRGRMSPGVFWGLVGGGIGLAVVLVVVVLIIALPRDTRANAANFQRIRQGMTEKEVVAIMGPPTRTIAIGFAKSAVWSTPTHEFVVTFMNDQVAMTAAMERNGNQAAVNFGVGNVPNVNFPNVNGGNLKVNVPNVGGGRDWTKLKTGMTEKEVVDRFGAPALTMDCDGPKMVHAGVTEKEVRAAHNNQLPPIKLLTYMDLTQLAHVKVTLVDGKVFKVRKQ